MKAIKNYFKYSFDFVGVCGRKEFWIVYPIVLFFYTVSTVLMFINFACQIIGILISLALLIPTLSLIVRRLHDTDRSAKYLLWWLFPFFGAVIVFIMLFEKTRYQIPV